MALPMKNRLLPLAVVCLTTLPTILIAQDSSTKGISISQEENQYSVHIGGALFTVLHVGEFARPILYPVHGPGQTPMTRNHPMKKNVSGEADDHPHHKSIWCAHGLINGVSFWHEQGKIMVDEKKPIEVAVSSATTGSISFHSDYLNDDKKICTDHTKISFHDLGSSRAIDWNVTIKASEGDITFGDTKEGMMAIRTHPNLRIDKGATAVNSEGVQGKGIWGKHAKWVDYVGKVEGNEVGVAIFDHPQNLRYPTTWHARAYGLVAANPFGLHHFEGAKKGTGDHVLKQDESIQFRYRFVFHPADVSSESLKEMHNTFAASKD